MAEVAIRNAAPRETPRPLVDGSGGGGIAPGPAARGSEANFPTGEASKARVALASHCTGNPPRPGALPSGIGERRPPSKAPDHAEESRLRPDRRRRRPGAALPGDLPRVLARRPDSGDRRGGEPRNPPAYFTSPGRGLVAGLASSASRTSAAARKRSTALSEGSRSFAFRNASFASEVLPEKWKL